MKKQTIYFILSVTLAFTSALIADFTRMWFVPFVFGLLSFLAFVVSLVYFTTD